jgi:hypothetical protein
MNNSVPSWLDLRIFVLAGNGTGHPACTVAGTKMCIQHPIEVKGEGYGGIGQVAYKGNTVYILPITIIISSITCPVSFRCQYITAFH